MEITGFNLETEKPAGTEYSGSGVLLFMTLRVWMPSGGEVEDVLSGCGESRIEAAERKGNMADRI